VLLVKWGGRWVWQLGEWCAWKLCLRESGRWCLGGTLGSVWIGGVFSVDRVGTVVGAGFGCVVI